MVVLVDEELGSYRYGTQLTEVVAPQLMNQQKKPRESFYRPAFYLKAKEKIE
jgi:hypothetical protein